MEMKSADDEHDENHGGNVTSKVTPLKRPHQEGEEQEKDEHNRGETTTSTTAGEGNNRGNDDSINPRSRIRRADEYSTSMSSASIPDSLSRAAAGHSNISGISLLQASDAISRQEQQHQSMAQDYQQIGGIINRQYDHRRQQHPAEQRIVHQIIESDEDNTATNNSNRATLLTIPPSETLSETERQRQINNILSRKNDLSDEDDDGDDEPPSSSHERQWLSISSSRGRQNYHQHPRIGSSYQVDILPTPSSSIIGPEGGEKDDEDK